MYIYRRIGTLVPRETSLLNHPMTILYSDELFEYILFDIFTFIHLSQVFLLIHFIFIKSYFKVKFDYPEYKREIFKILSINMLAEMY